MLNEPWPPAGAEQAAICRCAHLVQIPNEQRSSGELAEVLTTSTGSVVGDSAKGQDFAGVKLARKVFRLEIEDQVATENVSHRVNMGHTLQMNIRCHQDAFEFEK